ncbi:MAG: glycosyltransferase [Beutenbergiaceae bacterium]
MRLGLKRRLRPLVYKILGDKAAGAVGAKAQKQIRQLRTQKELLRATVLYLPRHQHDSMVPPHPEWEERWHQDRSRVLFLVTQDYGGSAYQWVQAINRHTEWAARLAVVVPHPFGYPNDLVLGAAEAIGADFRALMDQADVIQIKDESGFLSGINQFEPDFLTSIDKPLVTTLYGSQARRRQNTDSFRDHVNGFEGVVSLTPDLCFEWIDRPYYVPAAVDYADIPLTWTDTRSIAHSPSSRELKGTALLEQAVAELDLTVDIITGATHAQTLDRVAHAGLFFDQAGADTISGEVIGWYGNAALEAASRGIPTIAHLSPRALDGAERGGYPARDRMAILNTERDAGALRTLIDDHLAKAPEERQELSTATRKWVEKYHGAQVIGRRLTALYEQIRR